MGDRRMACRCGTAGVNCWRALFADGATGLAVTGFWALRVLSTVFSGSSSFCGVCGRPGVGNVVRRCGCRAGMEGWEGTRGSCPMEPSWVVSSNSSLMGLLLAVVLSYMDGWLLRLLAVVLLFVAVAGFTVPRSMRVPWPIRVRNRAMPPACSGIVFRRRLYPSMPKGRFFWFR